MSIQTLLQDRSAGADPDFDPATDDETSYRPWGYTIYRTHGNDVAWQVLLDTIHLHVRSDILALDGPEEGMNQVQDAQKFAGLFQLDARSDPIFRGKSMNELRALYDDPNTPGGVGMNSQKFEKRVFLVADQDVFDGLTRGTFVVKCIEADWKWEERIRTTGKPPRVPPSYFGWLQLTTLALVQLWSRMYQGDSLEEIAPPLPRSGIVQTWTADYRF